MKFYLFRRPKVQRLDECIDAFNQRGRAVRPLPFGASQGRLAGLDLDLSDDFFGLLLFGQMDGQDAVFELGFDLVGLHAIG